MGDGSMTIGEVLAKVTAGEELSDEEKAFLAEYTEPDVDALANARSKRERIKAEKKLAESEAKAAELAAELEAATGGGDDVEKLTRALEKANARGDELTSKLTAGESAMSGLLRDNALGKINVPWMDDVAGDYRSMTLTKAFDGIDTEDLGNEAVTKPIIARIIGENKRFIAGSGANGADSGGKTDKANQGEAKTLEEYQSMSGKELLSGDNLDKAFVLAGAE